MTVIDQDGKEKLLARTAKYVKDLRGKEGKSILEKFEIERRYWQDLNVDWGIVTDFQIPETLVSNIEDCYEHRDLGYAINFDAREVTMIQELVPSLLQKHPEKKLNILAALIDESYDLTTGKSLAVIKHMLANKRIALPNDIRWLKDACCRDILGQKSLLAEVV